MGSKIEEALWQCEICEKLATTTQPPKSFIPVTVEEPLSTWVIVVLGLMPTPKNDSHCKKYIITTVEYKPSKNSPGSGLNHL